MAKQSIELGTVENDGTGDTLRIGGDKINDNFDELYAKWNGSFAVAADYNIVTGTSVSQVANIQAAVDALSAAGGGTLQLGRGTYFINSGGTGIVPKDNVRIKGMGKGATILKGGSGQNNSFIVYDAQDPTDPLLYFGLEDITLDGTDCTVTNGVGNSGSTGPKGVSIIFSRHCLYQNVQVLNTPSTGFAIDFAGDTTLIHCHIRGCGRAQRQVDRPVDGAPDTPHNDGFGVGCHGFGIGCGGQEHEDITWIGCISENNWNAGFSMEFVQNNIHSTTAPYSYPRSNGFRFIDCVSINNTKTGFEINDLEGYRGSNSGAQIRGCKAAYNGRDGILIWSSPRNVIVESSLIHNNGWCGISMPNPIHRPSHTAPDPASDAYQIAIHKNIIYGHSSSADVSWEGWGILCKLSNVDIKDNWLRQNYRGGLRIMPLTGPIKNIRVNDNRFYNEGMVSTATAFDLLLNTDAAHRNIEINRNWFHDEAVEVNVNHSTIDYVTILNEVVTLEKGQGMGYDWQPGEVITVTGFTTDQTGANVVNAVITEVSRDWIKYVSTGAANYARTDTNGGSSKIVRVPQSLRQLQVTTTFPLNQLEINDNLIYGAKTDGIRGSIAGTVEHHRLCRNRMYDCGGYGAVWSYTGAATNCVFADNHTQGNATSGMLIRGLTAGTIGSSEFRDNSATCVFTPNGGTGNTIGNIAGSVSTDNWLYSQIAGSDEIRIANKSGLFGYLRFDSAGNFMQINQLALLHVEKSVSGATPDISGATLIRLSNGGATNVTSLSAGTANQEILVRFADANSTLIHSASLVLKSGVNETPAANVVKRFLMSTTGANAIEI